MNWIKLMISICMIFFITACGSIEDPSEEFPAEEEPIEEPIQEPTDEELNETEETAGPENEITFEDVVSEYNVLSSFETDGPGTGLGLGMDVLYKEEDLAFVRGHQGHALGHFRLLQVDHEQQKVIITHQYSEEQYEIYEDLQTMIEEEGEKAAFEWVESQDANYNELFFTSEIPPSTTTVTWNNQEWEAIEVEVKEGDEKYVFAKDKGLIQIHYQSELAQEIFGEIRVANRIAK
ncbi:hypothetical protein [Alkalihalobacterium elongatum]|uniref:hypothetical protein n=1 Tax=Alkalihalobacterium elongatum TaxID=2675466 RepID=UPI001C1F79A3|nr:hypothetical protein [Alkalihalobacterium elongatum]